MLGKAGVYVRTQVSPTGMFQPQHYLPLTPLMDKVSEQSAEGSDAPKTHTRVEKHTEGVTPQPLNYKSKYQH